MPEPGINPVKDRRAEKAYRNVIESGGTSEEASEAADKARNKNSGYFKNKSRKSHSQKRFEDLQEAWKKQEENNRGQKYHCMICDCEVEDKLWTIVKKDYFDERGARKYEILGCICNACLRCARPHNWLLLHSEVLDKIRKYRQVNVRARLLWRLSQLQKEQVSDFEEYVRNMK